MTVNADRGNLGFEETDADRAIARASAYEAPLTSLDSNSWEPPPAVKGDIARAMFYMALRYDGNGTQEADLTLTDKHEPRHRHQPVMGRLTTLLLWHLSDPVSPEEMLRNDRVQQFQGNRNPFVDHPGWVTAVYGDPLLVTGEVTGNQVKLSWWAGLESAIPEPSISLQSASWVTVPGAPALSGNLLTLTTSSTAPRRFYRIRYRGITAP